MRLLRARPFDRDVGLVLATFIVLLTVENVVVGLGYRAEFAGSWEMASARVDLSPIALASAIPVAIASVLVWRLVDGGRAVAVAVIGAIGGAALGIGVSNGRRMASLALRVPFVVFLATVVAIGAWLAARELSRLRPAIVAGGGVAIAIVAWLADAFALHRLYPAFHLALYFVLLGACGLAARSVRRSRFADPIALGSIVVAAVGLAWTPHAAVRVREQDNLRRILLERAPLLGRSVRVAAQIAPPLALEEDDVTRATLASLRQRTGARAIDWRGHDIVVITIDALRADHVSAYGYGRKTTPRIDALATAGVRFEHAYCPTPHTSYSIASMMTGKYMKPLLALTAADPHASDDEAGETWALQLRRYGYRTAAFYPPAVFFIDEHRFRRMRQENLGFEYYKEEFARPELRRAQIDEYLRSAPRELPLFLWVHLFEPHEPYEMHPEHPFTGDPRLDAYDSEVAEADQLVGEIVDLVAKARPPGTVFIVSADHGEEHGEHGGRYHGTTVYEEQVRVPLVVVAPGLAPRVVATPVQTIDLLPTSLGALDVPIPPRLRGRDLGRALAGTEPPSEEGLAFAETDDYTLVARGNDRLVCARKIGSCSLFDVARDPGEKHADEARPNRVTELRKLTAAIERETGKVEASGLPEALRRGLQGDRDAAEDVAPLLDDARVEIRRAAARCAFRLHAPEMASQLRRALDRDEDAEVRRWSGLALVRLGETGPSILVDASLKSDDAEERTAAALALAERGDARGEGDLVARWAALFGPDARLPGEVTEARELLAAFVKLRSRPAVPVVARTLDDVRLRPFIVEALAEIGDVRAKAPLLRQFIAERYVHLRPLEARALLRLGGRLELYAPLARFAGVPEPMVEAIAIAREAKLLTLDRGAKEWADPPETVALDLRLAKPSRVRVLVALEQSKPLTGTVNGVGVSEAVVYAGDLHVVEAGDLPAGKVELRFASPGRIRAVWLVPRAEEIPPPPPQKWVAPTDPERE